jgi:hypothetical protein
MTITTTVRFTSLITSCSGVLQKVKSAQVVNSLPDFTEPENLISLFATARHWILNLSLLNLVRTLT